MMLMNHNVLILVGIFFLCFTQTSHGANAKTNKANNLTMQPIFPLPNRSIKSIPFVNQLLHSPLIKKVNNQSQAEAALQAIKDISQEIESKGNSHKNIGNAMKILETHVALSYYFQEILGSPADQKKQAAARMKYHHNKILEYAAIVKELSKNPKVSALSSYYVNASMYAMENADYRYIEKLVPLLNPKAQLDKQLVYRIGYARDFIQFIKNPVKLASKIEKLSNNLPDKALITTRLALARYYAGFDANGRRISNPNNKYRSLLFGATDKVVYLEQYESIDVLGFAINLWRSTSNNQETWEKPPFNLSRFNKNQTLLLGFDEQVALQKLKKKDTLAALKAYLSIGARNKDSKKELSIDQQILRIQDQDFSIRKNYSAVEATLISFRKKYSSKKSNDKNILSFKNHLQEKHRNIILAQIKLAKAKQSSPKMRMQVITSAYEFIKLEPNESLYRKQILENIASLYILNKDHTKAVSVFEELVKISPSKEHKKYIENAIASQSLLAKWPMNPPWNFPAKQNINERKKLASLYETLLKVNNKLSWSDTAQLGILNLHLNNEKQAFELWIQTLKKSAKGNDAALAAGFMLETFTKRKSWQPLEEISRICIIQKINPLFGKKNLKPIQLLGLALLEDGIIQLKNKKYDLAIKKLEEYSFKLNEKNKDLGIVNLAVAYRGAGNYEKNLNLLIKFAEGFSSSKYYKEALLDGASSSKQMAQEDTSIFFLKQFADKFPKDPKIIDVYKDLVELYTANKFHQEAILYLEKLLNTNSYSKNTEFAASLATLMSLQESTGNTKKSVETAKKILTVPATINIRISAIMTIAQNAFLNRQLFEVRNAELLLQKSGSSPLINQAQGQIKFYLAEMQLGPILKSVNSPNLKNPVGEVFSRYSEFLKAKTNYDNVCKVTSSYCSLAWYRQARIAERLMGLIKDFAVPATLEEKTITDFIKQRDAMLDYLRKLVISADQSAIKFLSNGLSKAQTTQHILWQTNSDWNFDQITEANGVGYTQWEL